MERNGSASPKSQAPFPDPTIFVHSRFTSYPSFQVPPVKISSPRSDESSCILKVLTCQNKNICAKIQVVAPRLFTSISFAPLSSFSAPTPPFVSEKTEKSDLSPPASPLSCITPLSPYPLVPCSLFSPLCFLLFHSFLKNEYSFHPQICLSSFQPGKGSPDMGQIIRSSFVTRNESSSIPHLNN